LQIGKNGELPPSEQLALKRAFWKWLAEQEIYGT